MKARIDVQLACEGSEIPQLRVIETWVSRALHAAGRTGEAEVSVRVVAADEIRALNRRYRGKDEPTNVLSFPAGDIAGLPNDAPEVLGDIVVCASVVRNEAGAQGKPAASHWAHMLVHGALHLLGYDHETDAEARKMESLEIEVLASHGIPDPYGACGQN